MPENSGMQQLYNRLPKYTFTWKGALAMLLGMTVFTMALAVLNVISMVAMQDNLQYSDFFMILMNTAGLLGAIAAFDFLICRPQTGKPLDFRFSTTNLYTYLLVFPMMFGMILIAEFFTSHIPVTGPIFGKLYKVFSELMKMIGNDVPTMILMTVFLAPLLEEIIFRGIIQKGLINNGWAPWKAILTAAVVFGVVHANPWQFVGAVLLGSVLGLVYYKTKSLLLPILLHAFNNLLSCLLIINTDSESLANAFGVSSWLLLGAGLLIFALFYYLFTRKYRVHYTD